MGRKKLNIEETKKNIITRATTGIGYSIDVPTFNEKINSVKDVKDAAVFVRAELVYY